MKAMLVVASLVPLCSLAATSSRAETEAAVTEDFAREGGAGEIITDSAVDGVPLKRISYKQLSSNCRVEKRK